MRQVNDCSSGLAVWGALNAVEPASSRCGLVEDPPQGVSDRCGCAAVAQLRRAISSEVANSRDAVLRGVETKVAAIARDNDSGFDAWPRTRFGDVVTESAASSVEGQAGRGAVGGRLCCTTARGRRARHGFASRWPDQFPMPRILSSSGAGGCRRGLRWRMPMRCRGQRRWVAGRQIVRTAFRLVAPDEADQPAPLAPRLSLSACGHTRRTRRRDRWLGGLAGVEAASPFGMPLDGCSRGSARACSREVRDTIVHYPSDLFGNAHLFARCSGSSLSAVCAFHDTTVCSLSAPAVSRASRRWTAPPVVVALGLRSTASRVAAASRVRSGYSPDLAPMPYPR